MPTNRRSTSANNKEVWYDPPNIPANQHAALVLPPDVLRVIMERHARLRSPEVAGPHLARLVRDRAASVLQGAVYWAVGVLTGSRLARRKVIRLNDAHSLVVTLVGGDRFKVWVAPSPLPVQRTSRVTNERLKHEDPSLPAATLEMYQKRYGRAWSVRLVGSVRGKRSSQLVVFKQALDQALRVYGKDPIPVPPRPSLLPGSLMFTQPQHRPLPRPRR